MMKQFKFNITQMDGIEATDYSINRPTEAMTTMIPLLYQAGYLTIKDYDRESEIFKCAGGKTDMVVWMPDTVYVFELKTNGTAQQALEQIDTNGYAIPYKTNGLKVVKVGVKFDVQTRVPTDWVIG